MGTGGVLNLGDDLTTVATVARIHRLRPDLELRVVTDGARPVGLCEDATWVGALGDRDVDLEGCEVVVLSLAGVLHTDFAAQTASRARLADEARARGIPVVVTGAGLGVIDAMEADVQRILDAAAEIGARDPRSARRMRALTERPVTLVGDDALGWVVTRDVGALAGADPLVFHVRSSSYGTDDRAWMTAWARAIDLLAATSGRSVIALAINGQPPDEASLLAALPFDRTARWVAIDATSDPDLAVSVMRGASGGVVSSYHLALFALEARRPVLFPTPGPYYAHKIAGLAEALDLDDAFSAARPPEDGEELRGRLDDVAATLARRHLAVDDATVTALLDRALPSVGVSGGVACRDVG